MSIPASAIVNVTPGVVAVGGSGLNLSGLFLTNSTRVPIGIVQSFATAAQVAALFGPLSTEATAASIYFAGYDGSTIKPAQMLFAQYASVAVGAYLRSGSLPSLAQVQAMTGVLTISVNGVSTSSNTINLASATSYSNAASIIQSAFTTPGFAVTYDSVLNAFLFTNTATGTASTIGYASGSLSTPLLLTQATGATISQGAAQAIPGPAMDANLALTSNFATFTTLFAPVTADALSFAAWTNAQTQRIMFMAWEVTTTATAQLDTSSLGYQVRQANYAGTVNIYDPNNPMLLAAFAMGSIASLNFSQTRGRATLAFRSNSASLFAGVTGLAVSQALQANGYNFYGAYATPNQVFNFFYPGQVSGPFAWIDTMANEIWMNAGFQLALVQLLTTTGSVPYNDDGKAMVEASLLPQINAAVSYGAIRSGVTLSSSQVAQIINLVGSDVSQTLFQRGWYTKINTVTPAVRAARGAMTGYFLYTDGGSVQAINLNSLLVA